MKKIIISLAVIAAVAAVVVGGTTAFFSDTETSTGNTFTAGAIDLTIDNESYYNGLKCELVEIDTDVYEYQWKVGTLYQPTDAYLLSLVGTPCVTSWDMDTLNGHLFFDFADLKPGDWGEDTISIHVDNNDSWLCANIDITANDDVSSTEPELELDVPEDNGDFFDGELGDHLNFIFWLDDGDNVLEVGEDQNILTEGLASNVLNRVTWTLADSQGGLFGGQPLPGGETIYIGKHWCFGAQNPDPVPQDFEGNIGTNGPLERGTGVLCNGSAESNITQTDNFIGDISFSAVQSRHNQSFVCNDGDCLEATDLMLVLDSSGSIGDANMVITKNAATAFATALAPSSAGNHIGVVDFDGDATLEQSLTDVLADINTAIGNLVSGGATAMGDGIVVASTELAGGNDRFDGDYPDYMVIITDGVSNTGSDPAVTAANAKAAGTTIYVVGVGTGVDTNLLQNTIASSPAYYFTAANFEALSSILAGLASCDNVD